MNLKSRIFSKKSQSRWNFQSVTQWLKCYYNFLAPNVDKKKRNSICLKDCNAVKCFVLLITLLDGKISQVVNIWWNVWETNEPLLPFAHKLHYANYILSVVENVSDKYRQLALIYQIEFRSHRYLTFLSITTFLEFSCQSELFYSLENIARVKSWTLNCEV